MQKHNVIGSICLRKEHDIYHFCFCFFVLFRLHASDIANTTHWTVNIWQWNSILWTNNDSYTGEQIDCVHNVHTHYKSVRMAWHRVVQMQTISSLSESSLFYLCKYSTIPVVILCSIHSNKLRKCLGLRVCEWLSWHSERFMMDEDVHFVVLCMYLQEMTLILLAQEPWAWAYEHMSMSNANMYWKNKIFDVWSHTIDDCIAYHCRIDVSIFQ